MPERQNPLNSLPFVPSHLRGGRMGAHKGVPILPLALPSCAHPGFPYSMSRMALLPSSAQRDGHLGCGMAILPPRMAILTSQDGKVAILTSQDGNAAIFAFEDGSAIFVKERAAGRTWHTHGKRRPGRVRWSRRKVEMVRLPSSKAKMATLPSWETGMAILQPQTRLRPL